MQLLPKFSWHVHLHHSFSEVSPLEAGGEFHQQQGVHTQRVQSTNSTVVSNWPQSATGIMGPPVVLWLRAGVLGALGAARRHVRRKMSRQWAA